jgi:hypothetical protein
MRKIIVLFSIWRSSKSLESKTVEYPIFVEEQSFIESGRKQHCLPNKIKNHFWKSNRER